MGVLDTSIRISTNALMCMHERVCLRDYGCMPCGSSIPPEVKTCNRKIGICRIWLFTLPAVHRRKAIVGLVKTSRGLQYLYSDPLLESRISLVMLVPVYFTFASEMWISASTRVEDAG